MNLRPVIERELRVASRQRSTYLNRSSPGLLFMLITGVMLYATTGSPNAPQGGPLFNGLAMVLFCLIWLTVPLSTADSLSREKREDTLGLLLLTPLRPVELVISKLFSAFWQSSMLVLAIVPILAIPVLIGGITALDIVREILSLLTALIGAVTVGIVASSLCERRGRAWLLVGVIGALWLWVQLYCHGLLLIFKAAISIPEFNPFEEVLRPEVLILPTLYGFLAESSSSAAFFFGIQSGATSGDVLVSVIVLTATLLVCWRSLSFAARRVHRFAESRFMSARQERVQSIFVRERYATTFLHRKQRQLLDRNPILWLQQRRWSHRLVKWGWLLVTTIVITLATTYQDWGFAENIMITTIWLAVFMLFSLLLVTSSNLQGERESGALELLLVTPLTPRDFVQGRIRSFWKSFLPAAAAVAISFWYFGALQWQIHFPWTVDFWFPALLLAASAFFLLLLRFMPAIGLCFSLNRPGLFAAALNTLFFAIIIPWGLPIALYLCGALPHQMHEVPSEVLPFASWLPLVAWPILTAGFQFAAWRSARRKQAPPYPRLLPDWFRRFRLAWIIPWLVPPVCFGFFAVVPLEVIDRTPGADKWMFALWNVSAWLTLLFFGWRCRLALIAMLEQRQFGKRTAAD